MMKLGRDRRGGVMTLFALSLPVLFGCGMLAVDIGSIHLEARRLQGIADAAALAAAREPGNAVQAVDQAVRQGSPGAVTPRITLGRYEPGHAVAVDRRFMPGTANPNAVHVNLSTRSPTFFARLFGYRSVAIVRSATAMRADVAAFSIGSRLGSLNDGLLNAYLSALTGSSVSLSLMDYTALAATDIDLLRFSEALGTRAGLTGASFEEILAARVSPPALFGAAADAAPAGTARDALQRLASGASGRQIMLDQLIAPGALGSQSDGGAGLVHVDALSLATALAQVASANRQVVMDVAGTVPGLGATRLNIAVGERTRETPWIAVSDTGTPIIRTAQTRIYSETTIGGVGLPGIGTVAAIRVPVLTELASAEARLGGIACSAAGRGVSIEARAAPAMAAIADLDVTRLEDFGTPLVLRSARLLNTLAVDVYGHAVVDASAAEPWKLVSFTAKDIKDGDYRTISSSSPTLSLAASLTQRVSLEARVAGFLPVATGSVTRTVGTALGTVAPAIDSLLSLVTGAVGVKIGQADIRVTGMRCGQPVLVG